MNPTPSPAEIRYVVLGRPVGFKRTEKGKGASRFTPAEMRQAQTAHRWHALAARPRGWDQTGSFAIEVTAYEHPMQRGDSDNYGKLAKDAIQTIAYRNDRQVTDDVFRRRVDREHPRVEVTVRRLDTDPVQPTPRKRARKAAA